MGRRIMSHLYFSWVCARIAGDTARACGLADAIAITQERNESARLWLRKWGAQ